jgi:hypothetical protein
LASKVIATRLSSRSSAMRQRSPTKKTPADVLARADVKLAS